MANVIYSAVIVNMNASFDWISLMTFYSVNLCACIIFSATVMMHICNLVSTADRTQTCFWHFYRTYDSLKRVQLHANRFQTARCLSSLTPWRFGYQRSFIKTENANSDKGFGSFISKLLPGVHRTTPSCPEGPKKISNYFWPTKAWY